MCVQRIRDGREARSRPAWALPSKLAHQREHIGFARVGAVRLPALTATCSPAYPLAGSSQLQDRHRLVVLADGSQDLPNQLPGGIAVGGQLLALSGQHDGTGSAEAVKDNLVQHQVPCETIRSLDQDHARHAGFDAIENGGESRPVLQLPSAADAFVTVFADDFQANRPSVPGDGFALSGNAIAVNLPLPAHAEIRDGLLLLHVYTVVHVTDKYKSNSSEMLSASRVQTVVCRMPTTENTLTTLLTILTGVVVALATAFFTSRFYVHQAKTDLRHEYQRRFNEKKWETYTGFAATLKSVVVSTKAGRLDRDQHKQIARLLDFVSELWLVGSDDVVAAVLAWRQTAASENPGAESLLLLGDILIAMRRDLGDTTTKIEARQILATFINDVDTTFPKG